MGIRISPPQRSPISGPRRCYLCLRQIPYTVARLAVRRATRDKDLLLIMVCYRYQGEILIWKCRLLVFGTYG